MAVMEICQGNRAVWKIRGNMVDIRMRQGNRVFRLTECLISHRSMHFRGQRRYAERGATLCGPGQKRHPTESNQQPTDVGFIIRESEPLGYGRSYSTSVSYSCNAIGGRNTPSRIYLPIGRLCRKFFWLARAKLSASPWRRERLAFVLRFPHWPIPLLRGAACCASNRTGITGIHIYAYNGCDIAAMMKQKCPTDGIQPSTYGQ